MEAHGAKGPHGDEVPAVNCGECHEEEAAAYVRHGRLEVGKDPDLPKCWSCHGSHDITPSSDKQSRVHATNLPKTCRECHTNVDLVKKHVILRDKPLERYESSVHGKAGRNGVPGAATCQDCHAAKDADGNRSAHRILSRGDPQSSTFPANIPMTCGQCHSRIAGEYLESTHGQFAARGEVDAPICTTCHGEHGIVSPKDAASPTSAGRLAQETCTPCHDSELLNEKFGLPGGRLASYIDSYHGLKSQAGDVRVANCASCHGAHRILPSTDPRSSIHPSHLQETCGGCHPGISAGLAQMKIHGPKAGDGAFWADLIADIYIVLIVLTIGLMLLHNGADWIRAVLRVQAAAHVRRLTLAETAQHWLLAISFIVLVISGFSMRFSDAGWVRLLFGWKGGFTARGVIHRVAAVILIAVALWHVFYLASRSGRRWISDMLPSRRDLREFVHNLRYYLGQCATGPRFGRFSYAEKLEYWALVWGTVIMVGTGVVLWFDNYFVRRWGMSQAFLDVMSVIHYYEAWLAFLAVVIWHGYSVIFKPGVYPMNPAWIKGMMPASMHAHEHPDDSTVATAPQEYAAMDHDGEGGAKTTLDGESFVKGVPEAAASSNADHVPALSRGGVVFAASPKSSNEATRSGIVDSTNS